MFQTTELMEMAQKISAEGITAENAARVREVIANLTPEEQAFWKSTAPSIIDPEGLRQMDVVDYTLGGTTKPPCAPNTSC